MKNFLKVVGCLILIAAVVGGTWIGFNFDQFKRMIGINQPAEVQTEYPDFENQVKLVAALESTIIDLNRQLAALETQKVDLEAQIENLESTGAENTTAISELQSQVNTLNSKINILTGRIGEISAKVNSIKELMDTTNTENATMISGLTNQIHDVNADVTDLRGLITQLTLEILTIKNDILRLNSVVVEQLGTFVYAGGCNYIDIPLINGNENAKDYIYDIDLTFDGVSRNCLYMWALMNANGDEVGESYKSVRMSLKNGTDAGNYVLTDNRELFNPESTYPAVLNLKINWTVERDFAQLILTGGRVQQVVNLSILECRAHSGVKFLRIFLNNDATFCNNGARVVVCRKKN